VYRTLGGDRPREMVPIKEINDTRAWRGNVDSLPVPVTLTRVTEESEGSHVFEGLNPEDDKMEVSLATFRRVSCFATTDGFEQDLRL
jgi:hypothetical protein